MFKRLSAPLVIFVIALAGCGGGGSSGAPAVTTPVLPSSTSSTSTATHVSGTISVSLPAKVAGSTARRPQYIPSATTAALLFIYNTALGSQSPLILRSPCSSAGCTISWTTLSGTNQFVVEVDNGANVLAEASETVTLQPSASSVAVPTLTLNGVPAYLTYVSEVVYPVGDPTCASLTRAQNCASVTYAVTDASSQYITGSAFDGGPLSIGSTLPSSVTQGSYALANPDAAGNDYTLLFGCEDGTDGSFNFFASPQVGQTAAELLPNPVLFESYGISYPQETLLNGFPGYTCDAGELFVTGFANGTIGVQSKSK